MVILLDSITRLARAYNLSTPASGRILSGGVDSTALYPAEAVLRRGAEHRGRRQPDHHGDGAGRYRQRMDEVIFEEFKGTGNMELHLDRKLADKRIFPAIDIDGSRARGKEELLMEPGEASHGLEAAQCASLTRPECGAIELLIDKVSRRRSATREFLAADQG